MRKLRNSRSYYSDGVSFDPIKLITPQQESSTRSRLSATYRIGARSVPRQLCPLCSFMLRLPFPVQTRLLPFPKPSSAEDALFRNALPQTLSSHPYCVAHATPEEHASVPSLRGLARLLIRIVIRRLDEIVSLEARPIRSSTLADVLLERVEHTLVELIIVSHLDGRQRSQNIRKTPSSEGCRAPKKCEGCECRESSA